MKPRYMLDTNICIYMMGRAAPTFRERMAGLHVGEVVLSAVTLAELEYGIEASGQAASRNRKVLHGLLAEIPAVPYGNEAARAYGPVRLARPKRTADALDKLIASHALALGVTLVTNNVRDFKCYSGLRIENWT
jgi:tRNA(fMet)-specific endonuclease VapC